MSLGELKRINISPEKRLSDAFLTLEKYDNDKNPGKLLENNNLIAIDTLADLGLRTQDQEFFLLSSEKLLGLLGNYKAGEDNVYTYAAKAVLNVKDALSWYIEWPAEKNILIKRREYSIKLFNEIFKHGDHLAKKEVLEIYSRLMPKIQYHMLTGSQGFDEALNNYVELFPFTIPQITDEIKKIAIEIPTAKFRPRIKAFLANQNGEVLYFGRELAKYLLSRAGVDGLEIFEKTSEKEVTKNNFKDILEITASDIDTVFALENRKPGFSEWLRLTQGIRHLARYPIELLLDQFNFKDDVKTPWGIIINPYHDMEGSFHEDSKLFSDLRTEINGRFSHFKYRVRVVEGEGISLVKILLRMQKKYGPASFGFVGGHGDKDFIGFGKEFIVFAEQFQNAKGTQRLVKKLFFKDAPIILDSCSSGKKNGFAQAFSELGFDVTGPTQDSYIEALDIKSEKGKLKINPTYAHSDKNRYIGGKLVAKGK